MKKDIQPKLNKVTVQCITCGTTFDTHSTIDEIKIDTCSMCHPFYTGKMTGSSNAGRIKRFNDRFSAAEIKEVKKAELAKEEDIETTEESKNIEAEAVVEEEK